MTCGWFDSLCTDYRFDFTNRVCPRLWSKWLSPQTGTHTHSFPYCCVTGELRTAPLNPQPHRHLQSCRSSKLQCVMFRDFKGKTATSSGYISHCSALRFLRTVHTNLQLVQLLPRLFENAEVQTEYEVCCQAVGLSTLGYFGSKAVHDDWCSHV